MMIDGFRTFLNKVLILTILIGFGFTQKSLFGIYILCNAKQTQCQINTKRMVPGDWIGIFDKKDRLIAVGKITKIVGVKRVVIIKARYSTIYKSHTIDRIPDKKAKKPADFFKIFRRPKERTLNVEGGLASLGIGKGISGFHIDGFLDIYWNHNIYLVGRGYFINASGEAASEFAGDESIGVSVNYIGGLLGGAYLVETLEDIYFRGELSLGIVYVSAKTSNGLVVEEVVDNRIFGGSGFSGKLSGSLYYDLKGKLKPFVSASALKVQNSTNSTISIGLRMEL